MPKPTHAQEVEMFARGAWSIDRQHKKGGDERSWDELTPDERTHYRSIALEVLGSTPEGDAQNSASGEK